VSTYSPWKLKVECGFGKPRRIIVKNPNVTPVQWYALGGGSGWVVEVLKFVLEFALCHFLESVC
jgi:hypothetical protein